MRPRTRGFTLIELLVVFAIAASLATLAPPVFRKLQEGSQYRDTVRSIVSDLRQARQDAIAHGRNTAFVMDIEGRRFGIAGRTLKTLPASVEVKASVAAQALVGTSGTPSILFLPDGGSSGGSLELIRASGAGVRIRVDWLFGEVSQEPRSP